MLKYIILPICILLFVASTTLAIEPVDTRPTQALLDSWYFIAWKIIFVGGLILAFCDKFKNKRPLLHTLIGVAVFIFIMILYYKLYF